MTRILSAMPEDTYRTMMTPALEERLLSLGEVTFCKRPHDLSEAEYAGLWLEAEAVVTGWGVRVPPIETLERCANLRIVAHTAGSLRMFPRALFEGSVVMTSARGAIGRTVAEFCLMNALILLRRHLCFCDRDPARLAALADGADRPFNETLFGKTVGLIGFGCVGREFRRLLEPFGCRVLVADPFLSGDAARECGVEPVDLPTLMRTAKVVSLHAPDTPETAGLLGAAELALLQDHAVLLNSARGRLVDTAALTDILRSRPVYAALDVSDPEPLPDDHALRTMPNVLFTPHTAGPTIDDRPHLTATAFDDLARFLRGDEPRGRITAADYDRMSF